MMQADIKRPALFERYPPYFIQGINGSNYFRCGSDVIKEIIVLSFILIIIFLTSQDKFPMIMLTVAVF